ncbi:VanZ family protein [Roseovarius sp. SCSIO 43702]|uniref:VanZ family protein n=1 Tax=Roseovarius sp. SCSIO 43702 TaxID=2823043 RepID=UPI001C7366AA|nr:VanZ family protein [Roseovarius sp. SCSIO 43702]QYX56938.1 VanZ family protein [Roseovarius sp. SCSIO 43702]
MSDKGIGWSSLHVAIVVTLGMVLISGVLLLLPPGVDVVSVSNDKMGHVLAFTALVFPLAVVRPSWAMAIWFSAVAYGGLIEVIQPLAGRAAELADLDADALGAALGVCIGAAIGHWRNRRLRSA